MFDNDFAPQPNSHSHNHGNSATTTTQALTGIAELDFLSVDAKDALEELDALAALQRATIAAIARCAQRIEGLHAYRMAECDSTAALVAQSLEYDISTAQELLHTVQTLDALPNAHLSYRNGDLTEAKAVALARGVDVDPSSEEDLLHLADYGTVDDMYDFIDTLVHTSGDTQPAMPFTAEHVAAVIPLHRHHLSRSA